VSSGREGIVVREEKKVIVNVLLYLATGNCLMYDTVTHLFDLFQDADRMLGKKKEDWPCGNNDKLKRPI
jgi:hypothetical protein